MKLELDATEGLTSDRVLINVDGGNAPGPNDNGGLEAKLGNDV